MGDGMGMGEQPPKHKRGTSVATHLPPACEVPVLIPRPANSSLCPFFFFFPHDSAVIPSLFSPGLLPLSTAVVQCWYSASTLVHYSPRSVDTSLPGKGEVPLPKGMREYCVPTHAGE